MKSSSINQTYSSVLREAEVFRETKQQLGIRELLSKPDFSGFVDVDSLNGISVSMYVCRNDDGVALRCLWNGKFEPMSLALWAAIVARANCAFDVGAHSGIYSLVAQALNPRAAVVSLEPHPLNYGRLVMNLRANGFQTNRAINFAASDQSGVLPLSTSAPSGYLTTGGSISSQKKTAGASIPVGCTTLDTIAGQNSLYPQVVKIDVEGHELNVIKGANNILKNHLPDLIVESVFNNVTTELEALLRALGYRFYVIQDDNLRVREIDHLQPESQGAANMNRLNRWATTRSPAEAAEIELGAQSLLS